MLQRDQLSGALPGQLQHRHRGQGFTLDVFEEGAAAGREVVDAVSHAEQVDGGQRVAAAHDGGRGAVGETVGDVMSDGVVTTGPDTEVYDAAKMMTFQDIKRLPVVDEDSRLLGIISRADIVSVFTRPDDVIEDEIREDLIRRVLFIDPDELNVTVTNGVVTFVGEIGTRNEARLLVELASRLDGVLHVESQLVWRFDDGPE